MNCTHFSDAPFWLRVFIALSWRQIDDTGRCISEFRSVQLFSATIFASFALNCRRGAIDAAAPFCKRFCEKNVSRAEHSYSSDRMFAKESSPSCATQPVRLFAIAQQNDRNANIDGAVISYYIFTTHLMFVEQSLECSGHEIAAVHARCTRHRRSKALLLEISSILHRDTRPRIGFV